MTGLAACRRGDRHNLHVSASTFRANEIEQPGNVNKDRCIRKTDFVKDQLRTVSAFDTSAMDRESGFACRLGVAYRLCRLASCHVAGLAQCGANFIPNAHEHTRANSIAREGAGEALG